MLLVELQCRCSLMVRACGWRRTVFLSASGHLPAASVEYLGQVDTVRTNVGKLFPSEQVRPLKNDGPEGLCASISVAIILVRTNTCPTDAGGQGHN